jgi:hypothetical protein
VLTLSNICGRFTEYDAYRNCNTALRSAILLRLSRGTVASTLPWHRFFRISSNTRLFSIVIRFCTVHTGNGPFKDLALATNSYIFPSRGVLYRQNGPAILGPSPYRCFPVRPEDLPPVKVFIRISAGQV